MWRYGQAVRVPAASVSACARTEQSAELVLQSELGHLLALLAQSSNGLDWRSVLHALPETMTVRSMRRVLPTSRVVSLYLSMTDWTAALA